jgi:hypothetical protein
MTRQSLIINLTEPKQLSRKASCLIEQYKALLNGLGHRIFHHGANTAQIEVVIRKGEFESLHFRIQNLKNEAKTFILVEVSFITNSFRIIGTDKFNRRLASKNPAEKLCFLTEEIGGINHA